MKGRWSMQAWNSREQVWRKMEDGAAGHHWKPRQTLQDAVCRCLAWTGGFCIPAMQVVDLDTGLVWWRDGWEWSDSWEQIRPRVLAAFDGDPALPANPDESPAQGVLAV